MGGERKRICRLCLKVVGSNFEVIKDVTRNIFDVLLLNINLSISNEPVMCEDCTENVQKCFDFKSSCVLTEDYIFPFTSGKVHESVDLRKVYFSLNKDIIPEDYNVCRFCLQCVRESYCTSLDVIRETTVLAEELLAKCLPEMNFRVVKEPVICLNCMKTLDNYFSFIMICQDVEEKIALYIKTEGTSSKGQVQLSGIVQFLIRHLLQYDTKCSGVNVSKMEESILENRENEEVKEGKLIKVEQQELIIKDETNIEGNDKSGSLHVEEHSSQTTTKSKFMHASKTMFKCKLCEFQAKYRISLNKHMQIHEEDFKKDKIEVHSSQPALNFIDRGMFKSVTSTFQAKHMYSLQGHNKNSRSNKNRKLRIYQCEICTFEAKHKSYLAKHTLIHKKISEVTMYKCAMCTHQTKHKGNLQKHMLVHKKPSEITMHKCSMCAFQTKEKNNIPRHMLKHKKPSEIPMYKCAMCVYQAKQKNSLKEHMRIHMKSSEVTVHKCEVCSYQTDRKGNFNKHLLVHRKPPKIVMYKCTVCKYQTKLIPHLKIHSLCHKDPSEITMYRCEACTFQTKKKCHLKRHKQVHMEFSGIMHKCAMCTFQTRHKHYLSTHMLLHKDPSEITMYKCEICMYQTKAKGALRCHMRIHKDPSTITVYKCAMCTFQTKYKSNLKKHVRTHRK